MNHSIEWDNVEKTVVLQKYFDKATKEDLYELSKLSRDLLISVSHTVHLIVDERPVKVTLSCDDMQYLESHVPPNQGAVVMIVEKSGLAYKQKVQTVGRSVAPKAFEQPYFVESLVEARQLLRSQFGVQYP